MILSLLLGFSASGPECFLKSELAFSKSKSDSGTEGSRDATTAPGAAPGTVFGLRSCTTGFVCDETDPVLSMETFVLEISFVSGVSFGPDGSSLMDDGRFVGRGFSVVRFESGPVAFEVSVKLSRSGPG